MPMDGFKYGMRDFRCHATYVRPYLSCPSHLKYGPPLYVFVFVYNYNN